MDVGCGDGFHLRLLREFGRPGWSLLGVDTDARAVTAAGRDGLTVLHGRVQDLDLPSGQVHLVLLIMTVEHLADPATVLRLFAGCSHRGDGSASSPTTSGRRTFACSAADTGVGTTFPAISICSTGARWPDWPTASGCGSRPSPPRSAR